MAPRKIRVLGIETSCDETSVALLEVSKNGVKIVSHEIASQIPVHALYGGVVPEVAARLHVSETVALLERAVLKPKRKFDAVAVTRGPGLATALRVGIDAGRTLAFAFRKPIMGVNHLEGHLASAWLPAENRKRWKFPVLSLLVSGGHTELVLMKDFGSYRVLGRTRDDAAGEAFDKTAKLMGLGYPGGPILSRLAENGRADSFDVPRPMLHDPSLDFSFSGLKTAVRNIWASLPPRKKKDKQVVADLCASVQEAIVDVLVAKTAKAVLKFAPRTVSLVGGVSANRRLHQRMREKLKAMDSKTLLLEPARGLHTDNAAMIAVAGGWHLLRGEKDDWRKLTAEPEWDLCAK